MLKIFPQFVCKIPTKYLHNLLLQNSNKLEVVKIICTWKRNQEHTMFTNHFRFQIVTLQTELYDWWELDDHRFQSKLVFFRSCPRMAETMGTTSFKIFRTLLNL